MFVEVVTHDKFSFYYVFLPVLLQKLCQEGSRELQPYMEVEYLGLLGKPPALIRVRHEFTKYLFASLHFASQFMVVNSIPLFFKLI